jgi:hypothetical protein
MPTPQKCPSHPGQITARGIIRFLSGGGSHKIVLVGTNAEKALEELNRYTRTKRAVRTWDKFELKPFFYPAHPEPG